MQAYSYVQCVRKACSFRFPSPVTDLVDLRCPKCGAGTTIVASGMDASPRPLERDDSNLHLEGFLDNIRSIFNTGSIFRTSEGCGISKLHLGGITPAPSHPRMHKTSLGSENIIPWEQHWNGLSAIQQLKANGYQIISLEYNSNSVPLFSIRSIPSPVILVAGNENFGIDPAILAESHIVTHLPMTGKKESLNVAIAFSITAYWLRFGMKNER
jgi:tRNA G18 (ribose-2'-O)-methylase SpoU